MMKKEAVFVIFLIILLHLVSASYSSDTNNTNEWKAFGRTLNNTRYVPGFAPANISEAYFTNVTAPVATSFLTPVVYANSLFIHGSSGRIFEYNVSNITQMLNNYSVGTTTVNNAPTVDGDYVYFGSWNYRVYQLNRTNLSQLINSYSTGWVLVSPFIIHNSSLFVGTTGSVDDIVQLNATNVSQVIATYAAADDTLSSPAVYGSNLYAGNFLYDMYQLNVSNVSQKFAQFDPGGGLQYSSPAVAYGYVYVGSDFNNAYKLYQVNASNISIMVSNFTAGSDILSSPAVAHGYVYVGSDDNKVYQLNASNVSQKIADYTTGNDVRSSPVVTDNYVFVGSNDGNLYQLDAFNISKLIGTFNTTASMGFASPIVVGGSVYVGTSSGKLFKIGTSDPTTGFAAPPASFYLNSSSEFDIFFNCTGSDSGTLQNISLYITDSTNASFAFNQSKSVSGTFASANWTLHLARGNYTWNCVTFDTEGFFDWGVNRSIITDYTGPSMNITTPLNNTNTSNLFLDVNFTFNDSASSVQSCWYSNDTYSVNLSLICAQNLTNITWSDGLHNVTIYINDSAGNLNSSSVTFTVNNFPGINITYPFLNRSNSTDGSLDINFTVSDVLGLGDCWYSNDTYSVNRSTPCGTNLTNITWSEGLHNLTIWVNDTSGNVNKSSITFRIDATGPVITILIPTVNNSNSSNTGFDINATKIDAGVVNLSQCWYSNDTYTINRSIPCNQNVTNVTWSSGQHNVTIYSNDSLGNLGFSSISFVVDSTYPGINITFPMTNNSNFSDSSLDINLTISDSLGFSLCWYSNDSYSTNRTFPCGENLTNLTWSSGKHNLTIYINDSAGNMNRSSISFTIDISNPDLNITSPTVNNSNSSVVDLDINFTVYDANGLGDCWYSNDTYSVNRSTPCGTNLTNITWSEGLHNLTIWVNDSLGSLNSSSISFLIDSQNPQWFNNKTDLKSSSSGTVYFNVTFNDTSPGYFIFSFYDGSSWVNNTPVRYASGNETIVTKSISINSGTINWTYYVNDSFGMTNQTDVWGVEISIPSSSSSGSSGGGSSDTGGDYITEEKEKNKEKNYDDKKEDDSAKLKIFVSKGKTKKIELKKPTIKEFEISANESISGSITILSEEELSDDCSIEYSGNFKFFKSLDITPNFDQNKIERARMRLAVDAQWIKENKIKELKFVKCNPSYEELENIPVEKSESEEIHDVISSGFSTWAILGTIEEEPVLLPLESYAILDEPFVKSSPSYFIYFVLVILGVSFILFIIYKKRSVYRTQVHMKRPIFHVSKEQLSPHHFYKRTFDDVD